MIRADTSNGHPLYFIRRERLFARAVSGWFRPSQKPDRHLDRPRDVSSSPGSLADDNNARLTRETYHKGKVTFQI